MRNFVLRGSLFRERKMIAIAALCQLLLVLPASAQLGQNCTAAIQNRSVQVNADGTFAIPNVPTDIGFYRVRVVCKNPDGTTSHGASSFVTFVANGNTTLSGIAFGAVAPAPVSIQISSPVTALNTIGQTTQLSVTGTLADNTTSGLSTRALGTLYTSSNSNIASVGPDGLVTWVLVWITGLLCCGNATRSQSCRRFRFWSGQNIPTSFQECSATILGSKIFW
jgi:hypothetical protein